MMTGESSPGMERDVTEEQWLASNDPAAMLAFVACRLPWSVQQWHGLQT
jgi:hypothetical protein